MELSMKNSSNPITKAYVHVELWRIWKYTPIVLLRRRYRSALRRPWLDARPPATINIDNSDASATYPTHCAYTFLFKIIAIKMESSEYARLHLI